MKLLICGDTVPTAISAPYFKSGDTEALFSDVLPLFKAADRVLVNLECALTETEGRIPKCGPNLKGPVESAETLKKAGVTDVGLANNHMFDFGLQGMLDTIEAVEKAGINWTGAGKNVEDSRKPLVMEFGGKTLAIIAVVEHEYTYALDDQMGATPFDPFETITDVYEAKKKYDYVIVTYHGAKEQCRYPSPRLMKACRAMVHMGADAVLCQHSHIIGCYEKYEDGLILYGQGNFNFLKYGAEVEGWSEGLIASIDVSEDEHKLDFEFIPVVEADTGIRLANKEEAVEINKGIAERNAMLMDGTWINGWRAFCESMRAGYENSVYNCVADAASVRRREHFAHYLDCEAHTDVYRELFRTWHNLGINTPEEIEGFE